jgi:hypothetical protein
MPTFHARLISTEQEPLAGAVVRLIVWSLGGRSKPLVEGKTNKEGDLALAAEFDAELTLLPRIGVQLRSGSSWRDLGDTPIKVSRELIDFGTLIVSNEPTLQIGTRKIYAVESASVEMLAAIKQPYAMIADETSKLAEPVNLAELAGEPFELPKDPTELEKALFEQNKLLDSQLAIRDTQVAVLDAKLLELDGQLATAQTELEQAKAGLAEYQQASPLVDVVKDLGSQLGSAATTLDQAAMGMVLGDVSISLKGVSSGAGRFEFPTISQLSKVAGAEMSTIDLTFYPIKPVLGTPAPEPDKGPGIPNLLGYTELMARRKLEALQLGVEVSHKAAAKPKEGPSPWGRVVEQSPAPGAAIVPGTRVEILIGKPIDGEEKKG